MKDYKLSEIKEICEKNKMHGFCCYQCLIGVNACLETFGTTYPRNWEIDTDETDKVGE